jgi:indole-3-glycerol phosphate synthase
VILQKDFIIDMYQIYQARLLGADVVLLIVALLGEEKTKSFLNLATSLSMECIVEVHNQKELEIALAIKAEIIGINNRNLHTLEISLDVSRELIAQVPEETFIISESGISDANQIQELESLGFDAFLVGSSLMKTQNPATALKELLEAGRHHEN